MQVGEGPGEAWSNEKRILILKLLKQITKKIDSVTDKQFEEYQKNNTPKKRFGTDKPPVKGLNINVHNEKDYSPLTWEFEEIDNRFSVLEHFHKAIPKYNTKRSNPVDYNQAVVLDDFDFDNPEAFIPEEEISPVNSPDDNPLPQFSMQDLRKFHGQLEDDDEIPQPPKNLFYNLKRQLRIPLSDHVLKSPQNNIEKVLRDFYGPDDSNRPKDPPPNTNTSTSKGRRFQVDTLTIKPGN